MIILDYLPSSIFGWLMGALGKCVSIAMVVFLLDISS